ncbi:MAG: molecular chaperone DnaJ [Aeriscardovia sp.]|nr:molecular chaperone DnaJ [Aeriscardovia sp.]
MENDYYQILGVSRDASQEEIQKAYRKLSRQYHPDIAGKQYEDKFKEINEAYSVLSDPQKREEYDRSGSGFSGGAGGAGFSPMNFTDLGDLFGQFFGGASPFGTGSAASPIPRENRGGDEITSITVSLKDVVFGAEKQIEIPTFGRCAACKGTGSKSGSAPIVCPSCQGSGVKQQVQRSILGQIMTTVPCPQCQGHGTIIPDPCPQCQGTGRVRVKRTVQVKIPAGIEDGTRIKLVGQGEAGQLGGPAGDLYIEIHVAPSKEFARKGQDLHCWLSIPMTWAALGAKTNISTFDGEKELEIPAGIQYGQTVVMPGLGLPKSEKERGDIVVHVQIEIPTSLSSEQKELLEKFASSHDSQAGGNMQAAQEMKPKKGIFARMKDALKGE